jgi:hypothetical protein
MKIYGIIYDKDYGNSEDWNLNYLNKNNYEVFLLEKDRDKRAVFLNDIFSYINKTLDAPLWSLIKFEREVNQFVKIPTILKEDLDKSNEIVVEHKLEKSREFDRMALYSDLAMRSMKNEKNNK